MPRNIPEKSLEALLAIVGHHPQGIKLSGIEAQMMETIPRRTVQYHLSHLVDSGLLVAEGTRRGRVYKPLADETSTSINPELATDYSEKLGISATGRDIQSSVRQPLMKRKRVSYNPEFVDSYEPNITSYLTDTELEHLQGLGAVDSEILGSQPLSDQVLEQFAVDLAFSSTRLEGGRYTLPETRRLAEFGRSSHEKNNEDAQLILNHIDAVNYLALCTDLIGFNRHTLLNLHAILASNRSPDSEVGGQLRTTLMVMGSSTYVPIDEPQLLEEQFERLLVKASSIHNPFEQSLFILIQLSYLQPFGSLNQCVSRLAANIPMLKNNLKPLSFHSLPQEIYLEATFGVYELNRVELFKEVFFWAYEQSASRGFGQTNEIEQKYQNELWELLGEIVRERMTRHRANSYITHWSGGRIESEDLPGFRESVEAGLRSLNDDNYTRYSIRSWEFNAWQRVWRATQPNF